MAKITIFFNLFVLAPINATKLVQKRFRNNGWLAGLRTLVPVFRYHGPTSLTNAKFPNTKRNAGHDILAKKDLRFLVLTDGDVVVVVVGSKAALVVDVVSKKTFFSLNHFFHFCPSQIRELERRGLKSEKNIKKRKYSNL